MMSCNTLNQQNQQLHCFPLPPSFKAKSSLKYRDSRKTSFCKTSTNRNNLDPGFSKTTCKNLNSTPLKTFLDPYILIPYHQKFKINRNIEDNQLFTLYFNFHKTCIHTFNSPSSMVLLLAIRILSILMTRSPKTFYCKLPKSLNLVMKISPINLHVLIKFSLC